MNWKLAITGVATLCLFVGAGTLLSPASVAQDAKIDAKTLKPAASFQSIANERERSVALFQEAGKVIQHPRCVNCHPATDRPLQGVNMHPHQPPVFRGDGGMGLPGMQCTTCHSAENTPVVGQADTIKSIPGNPAWHLAPIEMAWVGKSLAQICQQIKDPARNGGKTMDQIVEHMAHDELVGWGWKPGAGREPVPGTQAQFGELISAWVKSGAACPAS
ncbi:Isoquinoline 1-oxidoreductase subunit [Neorhizobium sp. SHOUNA12A]|uniref:Isoquinoline 1-oxidoreductase subunit n=1 Tax=Neorhizobium sp. SHOUNA12A TaxID=2908923 RepID=UPI001FF2C1BE|nr:Isoquinoline 1-oxidoreductase subunit [Neorhizobium sp. SHOUNA12A]MCJ9745094.1 Isoquinoline 1-oxidoreductase subunit [Neorhizobium sp. SHOUNA12A]